MPKFFNSNPKYLSKKKKSIVAETSALMNIFDEYFGLELKNSSMYTYQFGRNCISILPSLVKILVLPSLVKILVLPSLVKILVLPSLVKILVLFLLSTCIILRAKNFIL